MAEDVRFTVVADTSEAKRELDAVAQAAERVQTAANRGGGGGGGSGGDNPPRPQDPRNDGAVFGKAAGRQIGRLVAAFMLHEVSGQVFRALRTPGQENPRLDMAQSIFQGALRWGTMGAMAGSMVAPGVGTAVGGAVGAVAGAVSGIADAGISAREREASKRIREEQRRQWFRDQLGDLREDPRRRERSYVAWAQNDIMSRLVESTPAAGRIALLDRLRREQGERSGQDYRAIERLLQKGMEVPAAMRERYEANRAMTLSLDQARYRMKLDEVMQGAFTAPPDIATDAFARRDLYTGAVPNPGAYQETITRNLDAITGLLTRLLDVARAPGATAGDIYGGIDMIAAGYGN